VSKDKQSSSIAPEKRERLRIMSRMTPVEKKAYQWKCYDETAKPKLLKLIEYCQSDNRIFPYTWDKIYNNYEIKRQGYNERLYELIKEHPRAFSLPGKPFKLNKKSLLYCYSSGKDWK